MDCVPPNDKSAWSVMSRYGLSRPEWDAMYFEQDGKCAIASCVREATHVDHCHDTGQIRGLLCIGCNAPIGKVEQPLWLESVYTYLQEAKDG